MSKLEELINKLCPNGVEFKTIGELFDVRNGYTPSKNNDEYWENGDISWYRMEDIRANGKILNDSIQHITKKAVKNKLFPKNSLMVATTATIGIHALIKNDFVCNQQLTCVSIKEKNKEKLNIKFCFYYFDIIDEECVRIANQGGGMPIVSLEKMKKLRFPVPPLEVQCEIVRILDNFTLLSAELSAELSARQKQYNFYRDKLLNKIDEFEIKNLEDCCNILDNKRKPVTKSSRISGNIPYYGANGIQDYVSEYIFDGRFVLVGEDGSVVNQNGNPIVNWAEGKIWVNNHAHIIEETIVDLRYLYYYIQTINVRELIHGNIPKLNQRDFRKLKIKVPSKEKQKEITDILDRFDKLCNDISEGLPAEIEARKKQYEYYRDKLLTFKELKK
ncbi:restriction endonuclease subunit S [Campylobacter lanienae]|uniref:restriction endonuclease subunit S n=1 Tax=Campylobacter lanienae TaxID=75658 RepID=UPI000BB3FFAC|nr:restriction endonuclease subunit S [Campylobacter lanienae]